MTEAWGRLARLFAEAVELAPDARAALVEATAASDPELAAELATLLDAHAALEGSEPEGFLDTLDPTLASGLLDRASAEGPSPGDTVGRYRIEARLGSGGAGVVYRAHDPRLDRPVALKLLSPFVAADERARARFVREARAASVLDHPHIATVHEVDVTPDGRPYIVMTYYDGPTLGERLAEGPLDLAEVWAITEQVAHALAAAHAAGVVHRDLKPGNVVLSKGGARVVDFGIAHADHAPVTRSVLAAGTMPYMSPEQTRGEEADAATDLWSLGVLVYEMLAGRRPFTARGEALVHQIRHDDPEPISRLRPDAPEPLVRLVEGCLSKDPADRPESAAQVVASLSPDGAPVGSKGAPPKSAAPTSAPPRSAASTLATLALAAVAIAGGWWLWGSGGASPTAPGVALAPPYALAVLPFEALEEGEADVYARGIHDDLLTRLSGVPELQVMSRRAVEGYRGSDAPERAARELGVQWVLEGSVGALGDRLRVNLRVVDPQTLRQVWARSYLRALTPDDLFAVEEQIVMDLARWLDVNPAVVAGGGSAARLPDLEVYRLYVEGRTHLGRRTPSGLERAANAFQLALSEAPDHAAAWAGLADAFALQASYGYASPDEVLPRARDAAERALRLSPDLAEAHASLGLVREILDHDGPGALESLRRAVQLQPSYAAAHQWLGGLLLALGRLDDAAGPLHRAALLDPTSPSARLALARWYQYADSLEPAFRAVEVARGLEPGLPSTRMLEGELLRQAGRLDEARETLERALELPGVNPTGFPGVWVELALVHWAQGDTTRSRSIMADLGSSVSPFVLASAEAGVGRRDEAFEILESAPVVPAFANVLRYHPVFDALRGDPRLDRLLRRYDVAWGLQTTEGL